MDECGDRGADEQRGRRHPDEGLPTTRTPGGHRAEQMVEGSVARFEVLHGTVHHPAQRGLVEGITAGGTGALAEETGRTLESQGVRAPTGPVGPAGPVVGRGGAGGTGVRTRPRVAVRVRGVLRPVVHNSVSSPVIPMSASRPAQVPVPVLAPVIVVVTPTHACASITTRSAAMPREPYAFTEPRDIPSVSATCASVMSAK